MQRAARGPGERFEGMFDELGGQRADTLATKRKIDHRVRAAADIDGHARQRLIHGHAGVAETTDAGAIAERGVDGGTEHERHVLGGVVFVHLEVAGRGNRQVEQGMVGERGQQVVEEADARRDLGPALTVELEVHRDVGLPRHAPQAGHPWARGEDVKLAEWRTHDLASPNEPAASMRRSFSSLSRTVIRRQWANEWSRPKVRGTMPRRSRSSATRPACAGVPKSTSRKFVTDGPTDQPDEPRAEASRARSRTTRSRFSSRMPSSRRASVTIATEGIETEPGGRHGAIRAMISGRASANPTRRPARA